AQVLASHVLDAWLVCGHGLAPGCCFFLFVLSDENGHGDNATVGGPRAPTPPYTSPAPTGMLLPHWRNGHGRRYGRRAKKSPRLPATRAHSATPLLPRPYGYGWLDCCCWLANSSEMPLVRLL